MTEASNNLPLSIDYTSRDFYSLRADLISRIKANIPTWSGTDPADFGVALVEAMAYMGDIANYYIDRVANESYIGTATQRTSILGYASSVGYTVNGYISASTTIAFGNSSSNSVTVPAKTIFYIDKLINNEIRRIKFTTDNSVTIPANTSLTSSIYTTTATQGYAVAISSTTGAVEVETGVYGLRFSTATGQANQVYTLNDNNVVDASLNLYVYDGNTYVKWTKVTDLTLYGKNDLVYATSLNENDYPVIYFGDGVSGAIPALSNGIWVAYNLGDGLYGNMLATSIGIAGTFILSAPGYTSDTLSTITSAVTFTNTTDSMGGKDPESNASIRAGASQVASTLSRAVTLKDYENISLTASNIGKVKAVSANYSSVTLFVAPKRDIVVPSGYSFDSVDVYPGYNTSNTAITNEMTDLVADVTEVITNYSQIGVSITVSPVYYTDVAIEYSFASANGYSSSDITTRVSAALQNVFSYANAKIADVITSDAVAKEIISVEGVSTATVTYLNGSVTGTKTLTGQQGQVFVITSITGTNTSVATLSGLTATYNGTANTPYPTFPASSESLPYVFTVSGTPVAGFVLTPSTADTYATITVGGNIVTSGSSITLPVSIGTNGYTVSVITDTGNKTDYPILIIRTS
jgi:hypothetical protein